MPFPAIETVATAVTGLGGVAYLLFRKLKSDKTSDTISENAVALSETVDARTQKLIDHLSKEVESKTNEVRHLTEVAEKVSVERNEAVQQVGKLEATVHSLGIRVTEMRNEMEKLETENSNLANQVAQMTKELRELGMKMVELATKNQELITVLQEKLNVPSKSV